MATFRELLNSIHSSKPVLLAHISNPFGDNYYLNNSKKNISFAGNDYQPCNMKHELKTLDKQDEFKNIATLQISSKNATGKSIYDRDDAQRWTAVLYGYDENASNTELLYTGIIAKVHQNDLKWYTLDLLSGLNLGSDNGIKASFNYNCSHTLYDSFCKVNANSFGDLRTVNVSNATTLIIQGNTRPSGWYNNGYVRVSDSGYITNRIVHHSGNTLILASSIESSKIDGKICQIYAGCDKSSSTCANKFGNMLNFGGEPAIPKISPNNRYSF